MCCTQEILVNHSGNNISSKFHVGVRVQHLHVLLNLILNFGDALLQDLLAMYRTVSGLPFSPARFVLTNFTYFKIMI